MPPSPDPLFPSLDQGSFLFPPATRRLLRDMKELSVSPVSKNISAAPLDTDIYKWHGNLRIQLADIAVHFQLLFTPSYPRDPPSILLSTLLPHPNVHRAVGGYKICLDMLDSASKTPYKGWSQSYSAKSILMQLEAFMLNTDELVNPYIGSLEMAQMEALHFRCDACHHDSASGNIWPPWPTDAELNNKVLRDFKRPPVPLPQQIPQIFSFTEFAAQMVALQRQLPPSSSPPPAKEFENSTDQVPRRSDRDKFQGEGIVCVSELNNITIQSEAKAAEARSLRAQVDIYPQPIRRNQNAGHFRNVPPEIVQMILLCQLSPRDIVAFSGTCRHLRDYATDGYCWKKVFSDKFPVSDLRPTSMEDWMPACIQEINFSGDDLRCYSTKSSWEEDVLGVPITYTIDPTTGRVDYVKAQVEFLSRTAFMNGCRTTIWNHEFQEWCPIYINQEHFQRGLPDLQALAWRLSPNHRLGRLGFHPQMAAELCGKILNTFVSLLMDRAIPVSSRAIEGYFMFYRLLIALVEAYPSLKDDIDATIENFRKTDGNKMEILPSVDEYMPLLAISTQYHINRHYLLQSFIAEWFIRQVTTFLRQYPSLEAPILLTTRTVDHPDLFNLNEQFSEVTKVGRRIMAFHIDLLVSFGKIRAIEDLKLGLDMLYGHPPRALVERTRKMIEEILDSSLDVSIDPSATFFPTTTGIVRLPRKLTTIVRRSLKRSLYSKYHESGKIPDHPPVSHLLLGGERYSTPPDLKKVVMKHNWRWKWDANAATRHVKYLDAVCSIFDFNNVNLAHVDYTAVNYSNNAIIHSGDTLSTAVASGEHTITLDMEALSKQPNIKSLVFSAAGWGFPLRDFKNPEVTLSSPHHAGEAGRLCHYTFKDNATAGELSSVVLCILWRRSVEARWEIQICGELGSGRVGRHGYVFPEAEAEKALSYIPS